MIKGMTLAQMREKHGRPADVADDWLIPVCDPRPGKKGRIYAMTIGELRTLLEELPR
jgi:hypothetical protein